MNNDDNNETHADNTAPQMTAADDTPVSAPVGSVTPITPGASDAAKAGKIKRVLQNKRKLALVLIAILLIAGVSIYAFLKLADNESLKGSDGKDSAKAKTRIDTSAISAASDTVIADKFIPSFSDMRGYAEFEGAHWYATFGSVIITKDKGYTVIPVQQLDNLTSLTGITEHGGKLWISGQGGIARRNGDAAYTYYLKGEQNVQIFEDPHSNTLYAATFKNLYVYEDSADSFSPTSGGVPPVGARKLGFTKDHIVAVSPNHNENNNPVNVFNKQTKTWTVPKELAYFKSGARSAEVDLIQVGDQVVTYGRHADYLSCESQGKFPATVVYQLQKDGKFAERKELTDLFRTNEAHGSGNSAQSLEAGGGCGEGTDKFVIDLADKNGLVEATNKRAATDMNSFSFYTYNDRIDQLQKELGFAAKINLYQNTSDNSTFSMWQDGRNNTSIYRSKNVLEAPTKIQANKDVSYAVTKVTCGGAEYLLSSTGKTGGFNSPYLVAIMKLDDSKATTVYATTNKPLYESVDPEVDLASSEGICIDGSIVLLGTTQLAVYDTKSKKITFKPLDGTTAMGMARVLPANDGYGYVDTANKRFVRITGVNGDKKFMAFPAGALPELGYQTMLFQANDTFIVIRGGGDKTDGTALVTLSAVDGTLIEKTGLTRPVAAGSDYDGTRFILQYGNGETKLVDSKTHKGTLISKPKSIATDGDMSSFSLTKDPDSDFVLSNGYVWFSTRNFGVIGYKAN